MQVATAAAAAEEGMVRAAAGDAKADAMTTTLCCSNMTGFHECVEDCFGYFPREQADLRKYVIRAVKRRTSAAP